MITLIDAEKAPDKIQYLVIIIIIKKLLANQEQLVINPIRGIYKKTYSKHHSQW